VDLELADRNFLITGGTDGLGLALALTLVDEGARVAVCGRNPEKLAKAKDHLGSAAIAIAADVTNHEDLDRFFDTSLQEFGRLDGVVNNAGQSSASPVATSSDDAWRSDYELKVMAALHLSRRSLDALEESGGSIVNVLAVAARAPRANSTPTASSRAAGLALTKALANEVGPRGIRVNAILIGLIESGQWTRIADASHVPYEEFYASMASGQPIPLGRVGKASEFADVAAFLLSPRASYVTGVGISVDGGLSPVI